MVAHPHYLQSEEADLRRLKFILPIDSIVPLVSVKTAELESTGRICEIYQALSKPYNEESMSPWGGRPLGGEVEADIPEDQSPGALVSVKFKGP